MDKNVDLPDIISQLNDLELAVLVCLSAEQHCIVRAPEHLFDEVQAELESAALSVFGLSFACLECSEETTFEDFSAAAVGKQDSQDVDSQKLQDEVCKTDTLRL